MKKRKPKTPKDPIRKKNGKIRLHALTLEEDLKYRGPLSYREFKIFGWLCIVIAQIIILMRLGIKVNPQGLEGRLNGWMDFLSWISPLALPFLLMSNFAVMLDNRKSYKSLIMTNALMMLGMFLMFILLFYHFLIGSLEGLSDGNMNFKDFFTKMYYEGEGKKFFAFNIFVDLFLCSVFMFFVNYRPTRFFQGKKRIIFRLFAVLPIAYELVSLALKWLSFDNTVRIPFILFPLLTVKPPMTFVVFVALTLFVKRREKKYIKMGGTYEGYQEFLQTNRNSFTFSLHATIIMFVAGALDLILVIIIPSVQIVLAQQAVASVSGAEAAATYDMDTAFIGLLSKMFTIGVGGASQLIVFAPIMLLFSYTRKRDNKIIDTLIPVAAIVLMLLVYLQGFFQLMYNLPISGKINFKQIVDTADELKVYLPQMMNMVV